MNDSDIITTVKLIFILDIKINYGLNSQPILLLRNTYARA